MAIITGYMDRTNIMRSAQLNHDNKSPAEDDGREEYIDEQAEILLQACDSQLVPFFTERGAFQKDGFDQAGTAALIEADDSDSSLLQLVLCVRNGEFEKAQNIAALFERALVETATKLIREAMEKHNDRD